MLKNVFKKYYIILPLILVCVVSLLSLKSGKIIMGGDVPLYELNPWKFIKSSFYLWNSLDGVGRVSDHFSSGLIFYFFDALLVKIFNYSLAQKIIFFALSVLPIFSINYLVRKIFKQDENYYIISIIASLFYIFNLYQLQTWSFSLIMYQIAYVTTPIFIGLLINKEDSVKNLLLFAFFSLINSLIAMNIAIFIGQAIIMALLTIWFLIFSENRKNAAIYYAKYMFVFLVINSFWLIQFVSRYLGNLSLATNNDWNQIITAGNVADTMKYNVLSNAFRLISSTFYGFWLGKYDFPFYRIYESLPFIIINFSFIILIILGVIFFYKKSNYKKYILFFLSLAIIGLFLYKGAAAPFQSTYLYLIDRFPILSMFRTPQNKFGLMIVLPYSILFGWSIKEFLLLVKNRFWKIFLFVFIIALICVNLFPYWQGKMFFPKYQNKIPESYFSIAYQVNKSSDQGRVLILPFYESTWISTNWNYIGYDPLYYMLNKPYFSRGFDWMSQPNTVASKQIMTALTEKSVEKFSEVVNRYQIDTIVIHRDYNFSTFDVPNIVADFDKISKNNNEISLDQKYGELELYKIKNSNINDAYFAESPAVIHGAWQLSDTKNYKSMFDTFFVTDQNREQIDLLNNNVASHIYNFSAPEIKMSGKNIDFTPNIYGEKEIYVESAKSNYEVNINGKNYQIKDSGSVANLGKMYLNGELTLKVDYDPLMPLKSIDLNEWQINDSSLKTSNNSSFEAAINENDNRFFNLISKNGQAGIRKKISDLDKKNYYMFSFDYKNVSGDNPRFIIEGIELKSGAEELNKVLFDETLTKSSEINHKDIILKTDPFDKIFIYFYSNKEEKNTVNTENVYGNIELKKIISPINSILVKDSLNEPIVTEKTLIEEKNPDQYEIDANGAKNNKFLILQEGYHPYWIASSEKVNFPHLIANFYSNAWLVPANTTKINIQFKTHNLLWVSYVVAAALFGMIIALYIKEKLKNEKN
jgi:hypothetical protein